MRAKSPFFTILLISLFLALLVSLVVVVERVQLERSNTSVELVLDYVSFKELTEEYNIEEGPFLEELAKRGVTSLGLLEMDLKSLVKENQLLWTTPEQLKELYYLTGIQFPSLEEEEGEMYFQDLQDGTLIFTPSPEVASYLRVNIPLRGEGLHILREEEYSYLFYVEGSPSRITEKPLGFLHDLTMYIEYGLRPLPRIKNQEVEDPEKMRMIWEAIYQLPSTIIFGGGEVFGYDESLDLTTTLIQEGGHLLGVIEPFIAVQQGSNVLARNLDAQMTRVHSIQQEEMAKLSQSRVISRFLRSIRERNVRTLYLRLFHEEDPIEVNLAFIEDLVMTLEESGFTTGPAQPFSHFSTSLLRLFLVNCGILAGCVLFSRFFLQEERLLLFLFLTGLIFSLATILLGQIDINRQVMGLLTALIFPSWGIILVIKRFMHVEVDETYSSLLRLSLISLFQATLITLLGGLLIVGLFNHLSYLLQIQVFRGIKLAFILPLLLILLGFFSMYRGSPWRYVDLLKLLREPICFKHLLWGGFLFLAVFIYLARTGNFPLVPVPNLEILFREFLESIMVYRPRFKEFLVGHPMILLAAFFYARRKVLPIFILLGSIGQLSIINSFAHLHTPLMVTLWRTLASLLLGIPIGLLLLLLLVLGDGAWGVKKERTLS